jgi:hypothetical protein
MSRPSRRAQSPSQTHPLLQGVIADWHSRPGGAWSALPDAPVHADEPPRWTRTSTLLNRIRTRAWTRTLLSDLDAIAAEVKAGTLHRGRLSARRPHPPR